MGDHQSRWGRLGWALVIAGAIAPPSIAVGQAPPPTPAASPLEAAPDDPKVLADQVRQLVEMNKKLADQLGDLSKKYEDLNRRLDGSPRAGDGNPAAGRTGSTSGTGNVRNSDPAGGGSGGGVRNQDEAQDVGNRHLGKIRLFSSYDYNRNGYVLETEDSEYQLKVRALFQGDARVYQQTNQNPVSSGFCIPRARLYFSGRITRPIEYQVSISNSFDTLSLLNAFINYHYDDRFQFRVGREKTPYTYEFYKLPPQDLLAPERSIFNVNFQGNRQVGLMAWGEVFGKKLEYAVGIFDGGRNSYVPFGNGKDVMAFLNYKPFRGDDSPLRNLNLGGSLDYGYENNPLSPAVLRTSSQVSNSAITSTSGINTANVPFLAFNSDVKELGVREQWDLHAAYYYKGLSLLGSWSSGFNSWALTTAGAQPVAVPIGGYFVQAAYLLTGETRNDFGVIDPLRPFNLQRGKFGPGAIEPTARFSTVYLGQDVFRAGFADPNLWTNDVRMTDLGFNWYLNKYAKIYFDWEQAVFGQPVYYKPGSLQKTSDLFWFRFQLYF